MKAEDERLAKAAAEKADERLAALKAEEERLAREAAEKAEVERLAVLKAEEERLAREAAEKAEAARLAREEALRVEREEDLRIAGELAAASEVEEAPPASARQPRDELRPLDTALPGLDEEELPPESGEVESQRKPSEDGSLHPSSRKRSSSRSWPAPGRAGRAPRGARHGAPIVVEVGADITSRRPIEGDVASFLGAVRGARPASFGDLLEATLSLGS